ncbi:hypothetical protein HK17_08860 [Acetobacter indonesiensis]|uniref:Uncharacterized protein n=1 Tax=Acetobacter indonesiensis TaxID=104101 RepID=A0A252ASE8_9PROT|nr:hypothetical protein HK17_08860 [Acetobacter indonesiensis]
MGRFILRLQQIKRKSPVISPQVRGRVLTGVWAYFEARCLVVAAFLRGHAAGCQCKFIACLFLPLRGLGALYFKTKGYG